MIAPRNVREEGAGNISSLKARLRKTGKAIYRRLTPFRRGIALFIYGFTAVFSYALGYVLRFELTWPGAYTRTFLVTLPVLVLIRMGSARVFRLTLGRWRYVGIPDVGRLVLATAAGSVAFLAFVELAPVYPAVPRSVVAIEWVLTTYVIAGLWISYRMGYESLRSREDREARRSRSRTLVVGAGEAGSHLVREMRRTSTPYLPVGFVDDDPMKWGTTLHGIEVIGSTGDLPRIAEALDVEQLIIALPSIEPEDLRVVVERCDETGLPHKVLPGVAEVLQGRVSLSQLRDVEVEDLLGREPVELTVPELREEFRGATVLVTGAAGSIGSELVRQIAVNGPDTLVLLDQAESNLYFVDMELRKRCPDVEIVPVVADVLDKHRLERVFAEQHPDFVFHAAAYKHVPLMEKNQREAIRNNVLGTFAVASTAARHGARKVVLISTDKAVRPANVMGATKRVAELITLACQERYPKTWFTAVRFGNVLGSQGSVLPVFRRQLENDEPLTVTHPDVTRYFMTVGEAVQLVLKSSLIAEARGHIVMLDMGEPVRILDLARNLLRLSGVSRNGRERIRFTGLRAGEKLHEELRAPEEEAVPTAVPKVRVLCTNGIERSESLLERLDRWDRWLQERDGDRVLEELWDVCRPVGALV